MKFDKFVLFIALVILLTGCFNKYSVKYVDGAQFVKIFNGYYYRINPSLIDYYYVNRSSGYAWAKIYIKNIDPGRIKLYLYEKKIPQKELKQFKSDFKSEMFDVYNVGRNNFYEDDLGSLWPKTEYVSVIRHNPQTMNIEPKNAGWKNGYIWTTNAANTEINVYFLHNNRLVLFNMLIEYIPQVSTADEASGLYIRNKNEIVKLIKGLRFN